MQHTKNEFVSTHINFFNFSISLSFQSPLMLISYICPSKMCLATSSMGKPNQPVETAPRKQTPDRCTVSYWLPASMKLYEWIPPPPCRGRAVLRILFSIVCYIIAVPESMSYSFQKAWNTGAGRQIRMVNLLCFTIKPMNGLLLSSFLHNSFSMSL